MIIKQDFLQKRRRKPESELARAVGELKLMGAERIILTGSMAEGNPGPMSDIGLLVVMPTQERFPDRLKEAYARIRPSVAMDILIYSPQELEEMRKSNAFIARALERGRVLHAARSREGIRTPDEAGGAGPRRRALQYVGREMRPGLLSLAAGGGKGRQGPSLRAGQRIGVGVFGGGTAGRRFRGEAGDGTLKERGSFHDRFYIPTRYPNGLPGGIPSESFHERDAEEAMRAAEGIIEAVKVMSGKR
mgnify:CR=1 FL=1